MLNHNKSKQRCRENINQAFPFSFVLSSPSDTSVESETAIQNELKSNDQMQKEHDQCNEYVTSGLNRNMTIKFLMERLIGMGCTPPNGFINCIDCGTKYASGGFGVVEEETTVQTANLLPSAASKNNESKTKKRHECSDTFILHTLPQQIEKQKQDKNVKLRLLPEIFLCQQHLVSEEHAHQSLVHELIHAIDLCRTKMDPINNCIHMSCTEIRAENLSGECSMIREAINGRITNFKGHGAECVKRRAILSVKANPNCKDRAKEFVEAAFERCYNDTFPFDRHPNLR